MSKPCAFQCGSRPSSEAPVTEGRGNEPAAQSTSNHSPAPNWLAHTLLFMPVSLNIIQPLLCNLSALAPFSKSTPNPDLELQQAPSTQDLHVMRILLFQGRLWLKGTFRHPPTHRTVAENGIAGRQTPTQNSTPLLIASPLHGSHHSLPCSVATPVLATQCLLGLSVACLFALILSLTASVLELSLGSLTLWLFVRSCQRKLCERLSERRREEHGDPPYLPTLPVWFHFFPEVPALTDAASQSVTLR